MQPGDTHPTHIAPVDLEHLLAKTSRTFALTIPLLPDPARRDVTLAYLLFRIADTLEDAERLRPAARFAALVDFSRLLQTRNAHAAAKFACTWTSLRPSGNPWYLKLLSCTETVILEIQRGDPRIADVIFRHARRSTLGMARFVAQAQRGSGLQLETMGELKDYCYAVAGIVGEMLTEIFAARLDWRHVPPLLNQHAAAFGEGLQLVNILKDSEEDRENGRAFIPRHVARAEVAELARRDLQQAETYVEALRTSGVAPGYVAFADLPLQLARGTLRCVELHGPGAKVSRPELAQVLSSVVARARSGRLPARSVASPADPAAGSPAGETGIPGKSDTFYGARAP